MLELKTIASLSDGCFSVLLWKDTPFAVSVERTFEDGQPIIKAGTYQCLRSYYYKGNYSTFEIQVPGHSRILFHKGNTEEDSRGCVCVAEKFSTLMGKVAVGESAEGFREFMEKVSEHDRFTLTVTGRE